MAVMEVRPMGKTVSGMVAAAVTDAATMEDRPWMTAAVKDRTAAVESGRTAAVESGRTAAVERRRSVDPTASAVESGATTTLHRRRRMKTSASAAAMRTTATAWPSTGTVMATRAADLDGRRRGRRTRGRLRAGTHRRRRLSSPARCRQHNQRGCEAEATGKTAHGVFRPHHDHLSLVQETENAARNGRLSVA
jgi:hypothetical protein